MKDKLNLAWAGFGESSVRDAYADWADAVADYERAAREAAAMNEKWNAAWIEFRAFADTHRKLMLGLVCVIVGVIIGGILL